VVSPSTVGATRTFIEAIDGRNVASLSSPFELLPGCHVVETAPHWVSNRRRYVYMPGDGSGIHAFPIRMAAGHAYAVVERWSMPSGALATLTVHAVERDGTGAEIQEFPAAATSDAAVQSCRASTPPPEPRACTTDGRDATDVATVCLPPS
jgi:hypothetical protein